jgi:RIO-like serine/threonine protein kinase
MSSISNFITLLNGTVKGAPDPVQPASPLKPDDIRILQAAEKASLLKTKGLASLLAIKPEEAAEAVDRLRTLNQIELMTGETTGEFFLRLTPAGYETLKTL